MVTTEIALMKGCLVRSFLLIHTCGQQAKKQGKMTERGNV